MYKELALLLSLLLKELGFCCHSSQCYHPLAERAHEHTSRCSYKRIETIHLFVNPPSLYAGPC